MIVKTISHRPIPSKQHKRKGQIPENNCSNLHFPRFPKVKHSTFDNVLARMQEIENTTPNADAKDMARAIQKLMQVVRDRL